VVIDPAVTAHRVDVSTTQGPWIVEQVSFYPQPGVLGSAQEALALSPFERHRNRAREPSLGVNQTAYKVLNASTVEQILIEAIED